MHGKEVFPILLLSIHTLCELIRSIEKAYQNVWNIRTEGDKEQRITVCQLFIKPHLPNRQHSRMVLEANQIEPPL